ncbi:uncharacterized protein GJ701_002296 isoform 1-T1 [Geothlypis trichas]
MQQQVPGKVKQICCLKEELVEDCTHPVMQQRKHHHEAPWISFISDKGVDAARKKQMSIPFTENFSHFYSASEKRVIPALDFQEMTKSGLPIYRFHDCLETDKQ